MPQVYLSDKRDREGQDGFDGRRTKGVDAMEDGVEGHQARENEKIDGVEGRQAKVSAKMEDGGERCQASGVETK